MNEIIAHLWSAPDLVLFKLLTYSPRNSPGQVPLEQINILLLFLILGFNVYLLQRSIMLIENHKSTSRSAPEERNKTTFLDSIPKKFILLSIQFQKS